MAVSQDLYRQQFLVLLPPGIIWPRDEDGELNAVAQVVGEAFARIDMRTRELLREADPRYATERLAEWERDLALPDECTVSGTQTVAERRAAVLGKLLAVGGQSISYYRTVLAALGYPAARIDEYRPHIYGRARHGSCYGNWLWGRVWRVHLPATSIARRRYGGAAYGEPYSVYGDSAVGCILNRMKPAHTELLITYGD